MHFTKMHGCGNDYIYIDGERESVPDARKEALVRALSDRHFGIGGDGVIFINPVPDGSADFEMEMYNADGSRGKMCGNGIRCVGKYVYDRHMTDKTTLRIACCGIPRTLTLTVAEGAVTEAQVDMGAPVLAPLEIPLLLPDLPERVVDYPIPVGGTEYRMTCVSMGNPHAVVFLPDSVDLQALDLAAIGPQFEHHPFFPERVNTEFVRVDDPDNVHMRVWERGAGETLACGTGCCAVTVACILTGRTKKNITVHVRGGDIKCSWDPSDETNSVYMSGNAVTVFEGDIPLQPLSPRE